MNGPQHYAEAERLLDQAALDRYDPQTKYREDANLIAAAQVHATLALAAAGAYPAIKDYLGDESGDGRRWSKVTAPEDGA